VGQAREKFGGASRNRDTKNNLGLKKRRISPFPHRCAEQVPAGIKARRAKISLPPTLSLFARLAFEF